MTFNIEESAQRAARALDTAPESKAADLFRNEIRQAGTREERRQFVERVDQLEKDNQGLDLVIKKDASGNPEGYAVIPKEWHQAAGAMAQAMDAGDEILSVDINDLVRSDIDRSAYSTQDADLKYGLFAIAVDAYEKDGVGRDVRIGYGSSATTKPVFDFDLKRESI